MTPKLPATPARDTDQVEATEQNAVPPIPQFTAATRPQTMPRYAIVDGTFHGTLRDGRVLQLDLHFKTRTVEEMPDELTALDSISHLARMNGADDVADTLEDISVIDARTYAAMASKAFLELQEAYLGEARSSSAS